MNEDTVDTDTDVVKHWTVQLSATNTINRFARIGGMWPTNTDGQPCKVRSGIGAILKIAQTGLKIYMYSLYSSQAECFLWIAIPPTAACTPLSPTNRPVQPPPTP